MPARIGYLGVEGRQWEITKVVVEETCVTFTALVPPMERDLEGPVTLYSHNDVITWQGADVVKLPKLRRSQELTWSVYQHGKARPVRRPTP